MAVLNSAFYRFLHIEPARLPALRQELLARCRALDLKGTVLLAPEGVNAMLAGAEAAVDEATEAIRAALGTHAFEAKRSGSETQPYIRMKVKLKKEIIP